MFLGCDPQGVYANSIQQLSLRNGDQEPQCSKAEVPRWAIPGQYVLARPLVVSTRDACEWVTTQEKYWETVVNLNRKCLNMDVPGRITME